MRRLSLAAIDTLTVLVKALRLEATIRRLPAPVLAERAGMTFSGGGACSAAIGLKVSSREIRRLRAVWRVMKWWPMDGTCLRESLLAGWALDGRAPALRFGVRVLASGDVAAHAWVEVDGRTYDVSADAYHRLV